jgi:hypothetical protein
MTMARRKTRAIIPAGCAVPASGRILQPTAAALFETPRGVAFCIRVNMDPVRALGRALERAMQRRRAEPNGATSTPQTEADVMG